MVSFDQLLTIHENLPFLSGILFKLKTSVIQVGLGWVVGLSPFVTRRTWNYRWNALHGGLSKKVLTYIYASFGEKPQKILNG